MDYGDDWPPATVSQEEKVAPLTLWQKCGVTVVIYAVLWGTAALVLHALVPSDVTLVFH